MLTYIQDIPTEQSPTPQNKPIKKRFSLIDFSRKCKNKITENSDKGHMLNGANPNG